MDDYSHYPWRALFEGRGLKVRDSDDELGVTCPFCLHYQHITFSLSAVRGLWICHRCGKKGNAPMLLSDLLNISYEEAERRLGVGTIYREAAKPRRAPDALRLPDEFEKLQLPETIGQRRFWKYAKRRRLTPMLVEEYGIGFCREGFLEGRLIVPFWRDGKLISYFARDITNQQSIKVRTCPGGLHTKYLFNLDRVTARDDIIIVEGVFDCLTLADRAASTSGKRMTEDQILQLAAAGFRTVYLCWDADAARDAAEAAQRLGELLVDVKLVLLKSGDPNELGREAVLTAVDAARSMSALERTALWGYRRARR